MSCGNVGLPKMCGWVCLQKCMTARGDIVQLIEDLMVRLTVEDMELFFVQCWVIWN